MGSCVSVQNHLGKNAAKKQTTFCDRKIKELKQLEQLEQLEQLDKEEEGNLEKISVIYRKHAKQIRPFSY